MTTFPLPPANDHDYLDRLINEKEVARYIDHSVRALQNWRLRGGGPKFVKVSARSVRYRRRDIEAWIDSHTVTSTSDEKLKA